MLGFTQENREGNLALGDFINISIREHFCFSEGGNVGLEGDFTLSIYSVFVYY